MAATPPSPPRTHLDALNDSIARQTEIIKHQTYAFELLRDVMKSDQASDEVKTRAAAMLLQNTPAISETSERLERLVKCRDYERDKQGAD